MGNYHDYHQCTVEGYSSLSHFLSFVNFFAPQPSNSLSALRPLTLQTLRLEQVDAAVALDRRALGGLWTANGYQREVDSPNSDLLALMIGAEPEPLMIGLACLWAILEEAHITLLAVDLPYRGQALGQALLYALLRLAQRRGLEWATLEVRPSNQSALALYYKFGFERIGERRGYYQDTGEAALILWRKGLQRPEFTDCLSRWLAEIERQLAQSGWQIVEFPGGSGPETADSANFPLPS